MKKFSLILLSALMIGALFLAGCGSSDSDLSLDTVIKDLQKGDVSNVKNIIVKSDTNDEFKFYDSNIATSDLGKAYYKDVTFKVIKMDKNDSTATAKVKFEYPNLKAISEKAFKTVYADKDASTITDGDKQIEKAILTALNDKSFEKEDKEIDINFEKGTDDWLIKANPDLINILCGELNNVYVVTNGTMFDYECINALKNLDISWIEKNTSSFKSGDYKDLKNSKAKSFFTNVSKRDKITFNDCKIDGNILNINISVITPDLPELVEENYSEMQSKINSQATETNADEVIYNTLNHYVNNNKLSTITNKFDLETAYNEDNNKFTDTEDTIDGATIANYIFGDMDNVRF